MLRVGFQVNRPARLQETGVALEKQRRGQPLLDTVLAKLGIGERDPYLVDLSGREERVDELDAGAQESDVRHRVFGSRLGAPPQAGAFDVDADEVPV